MTNGKILPGTYSGLKPAGGGVEDWVQPPGVLQNSQLRKA